ncbi:MAG: ATP-binding protein [bacterium]
MNKRRILEQKLNKHFQKYKQAIILLGARQVGKTTLLKRIFPDANYLLVDEKAVFDILESYSSDSYRGLIGNSKSIFIDELHLLSNPGRAVKLIYDQLDDVQIIVTGSSSLHIKNKTAESMAGRAINYSLYPLTFGELLFQRGIETSEAIHITDKVLKQDASESYKKYDISSVLDSLLLFGQYPHLVDSPGDKTYLKNLVEKAIFKDIIELNLIENRSKALELLKLLAYQIGNLISYTELSSRLGISTPTVQRYIDIFEQSFLIYRLYPYSKKLREEIGKAPKIYFWDLGLRNALIENFDPLNIRSDSGAVFENFIINEVKKEVDYLDLEYKINYWRLKSGSEVDIVLSNSKQLLGCEIKYSNGEISKAFQNRYPQAKTHLITSKNFI